MIIDYCTEYRINRYGGKSLFYLIECTECGNPVYLYQKDGAGPIGIPPDSNSIYLIWTAGPIGIPPDSNSIYLIWTAGPLLRCHEDRITTNINLVHNEHKQLSCGICS